jgi:lipooligosaccharide transport system permease protein
MREVYVYRKLWKSTFLSSSLNPIIYLAAMGVGLGAFVGEIQGIPYLEWIAPGLVASAAMNGATFEVTWNTWVRIHHDRIYEAMMATPINVEDVVAGEMIWSATRALVQSTVILVVLAAVGLVPSPWAFLIPPVCALTGLVFAVTGMTYNAWAKDIDQLSFYFSLFITPLFLFSGIFFPLDPLPDPVLWVAWATPLYHSVQVIRPLALGGVGAGLWIHVAWLVAFVAVFAYLPIWKMRRRLVV